MQERPPPRHRSAGAACLVRGVCDQTRTHLRATHNLDNLGVVRCVRLPSDHVALDHHDPRSRASAGRSARPTAASSPVTHGTPAAGMRYRDFAAKRSYRITAVRGCELDLRPWRWYCSLALLPRWLWYRLLAAAKYDS